MSIYRIIASHFMRYYPIQSLSFDLQAQQQPFQLARTSISTSTLVVVVVASVVVVVVVYARGKLGATTSRVNTQTQSTMCAGN